MSDYPYLLMSDMHYHAWSAFSHVDENGMNSRLEDILDATTEAVTRLVEHGGNRVIIGGDVFHVRGQLKPSVLNPVTWRYKNLIEAHDLKITAIPGNHDLETREATNHGSSIQALDALEGFEAIGSMPVLATPNVLMVPWHSSVRNLKETLTGIASDHEVNHSETDLVIHAPVDGVLIGIPDHGLDAGWLARLGFRRVFSGHYHNAVNFGNGVYSIGALTHQTWSDVTSKAGYWLVWEDRITHFTTSAPQFTEFDPGRPEEVNGNFVRAVMEDASATEVEMARGELEALGARGVLINSINTSKEKAPGRGVVSEMDSLQESIMKFARDRGDEQLAKDADALFRDVVSSKGVE